MALARFNAIAALLCLLAGAAWGQSVPNPEAPLTAGRVWTPEQWVAAWQSKLDVNALGPSVPSLAVPNIWSVPQTFMGRSNYIANAITANPTLEFLNFNSLRAFDACAWAGTQLTGHVGAHAAVRDNGFATYIWQGGATATADNIYTVSSTAPSCTTGRWFMLVSPGGIHPEAAGAVCDGVTDDSGAFNQLIGTLNALGGGTVTLSRDKTCFLGPAIQVTAPSRGVTIQGEPADAQQTSANVAFTNPHIVLAHGKTLQVGQAGTLRNLFIISQDIQAVPRPATMEEMAAHLATWVSNADVGVAFVGGFATADNIQIVGFNKCLTANVVAAVNIRHVRVDCINGVEISGAGDVDRVDDLNVSRLWSANLSSSSMAGTATPAGTLTGYTNGDVVTVATGTGGAICSTYPTFTLTVSGGNVTAATVLDVGQCTNPPGGFITFPAAATTGGSGTGLTLAMKWHQSGWRPGVGLHVFSQCDACLFSKIAVGGPDVGVWIEGSGNGLYETQFNSMVIEAGSIADGTSVGLKLTGCLYAVGISDVYASAHGDGALLANNADTATGCINSSGNVTITDLRTNNGGDRLPVASVHLGTKSGGTIQGMQLSGASFGVGSSLVADANVWGWQISNVQLGILRSTPWANIDATSIGKVRFAGIMSWANSDPAVTSCGTGTPSVAGGNDERGAIVTGTGAPTACTLTFGFAYPSTPACTVSTDSATITAGVTAASASAITIGMSAGLTSGKIYYRCVP